MSNLIYIARKLDGSWVAPNPAPTQDAARAMIAAHEPDHSKHSEYQILAETLERVLADQVPGIKRGIVQHIVKWDGDDPIPADAHINPHKYPQVSEVIHGGDGFQVPKVIYSRSPDHV